MLLPSLDAAAESDAEIANEDLMASFLGALERFRRGMEDFDLRFRSGSSNCVECVLDRLGAGVMGFEVSPGERQSRGIRDGKATKSFRGTTSL